MAKAATVRWSREHLLIALNIYRKLPFGKLDRKNRLIIDVAGKLGRTPSSLAMKLVNFASLDPIQRARGIRGLSGATKTDRLMWDEFQDHIDTLAPESEQMLHDLFTNDDEREVDFLHRDRVRLELRNTGKAPSGPTESTATVKVRRGQQFFRQSILNAYGVRCCISGINVPCMLVASHIKPWRAFPNERLSAKNGLCLSSIHDSAFDAGLITLDATFKVMLSDRLRSYFPQPGLEVNFARFEGMSIRMPDLIAEPDGEYLAFHRDNVFQR